MASKWKSEAGPRQTKDVEKSLRDLDNHFDKTIEVKDWGRMVVCKFRIGERNAKSVEALNAIGDRFAWTVTRKNYKAIIACAEEVMAASPIPEIDQRTVKENL